MRAWANESTALTALVSLGLERTDVIEETFRSPNRSRSGQGPRPKLPRNSSFRARSGISLFRIENARARLPAERLVRPLPRPSKLSRRGAPHE